MTDRIYTLLGLAQKAGRISAGEMAQQAVKDRKAHLLIIAGDASGNTREKLVRMAENAGVSWALYGDMESLGHAVGKADRACLAVRDRGFAASLRGLLEGQGVELHGELRRHRNKDRHNV